MNLFSRLRHLWALSEWEPAQPNSDIPTQIPHIRIPIKEKYPAKFIPYNKKTPAQEIVEQSHD